MSDDFYREIKKLAGKSRKKPEQAARQGGSSPSSGTDFRAVLDEFLRISNKGAKIYNDLLGEQALSVYELPSEFLEIFLGIPGRRGGLAISAPERLAVFFDEDPDVITVIGKLRSNNGTIQANVNKSYQLIKISASKTDSGYEYRDNTGKPLDSEGIISVIIGWLVQA